MIRSRGLQDLSLKKKGTLFGATQSSTVIAGFSSASNGATFGDNGNYLFVGNDTANYVKRYPLTVPYDTTTIQASDQTKTPVLSYAIYDLLFEPSGLVYYTFHSSLYSSGSVRKNILSVPWDLTSYVGGSAITTFKTQTSAVNHGRYNGDGSKFYMSNTSAIYQYSLSVAYDLTTATYDSVVLTTKEGSDQFIFTDDGFTLITGDEVKEINTYTLSTAYDLSTAILNKEKSLNFSDASLNNYQANNSRNIIDIVNNQIIVLSSGSRIVTYDFDTAMEIPSYGGSVFNFGVGLSNIAFSPDGLNFYCTRGVGSTPNYSQYKLSVAWDLSTASLHATYSPFGASQCEGFHITDDGTRIYYMYYNSASIYSATLSTPWDLGTAGSQVSKNLSLGVRYGIYLNRDGTEFYACGASISKYNLSTPFDITTAVASGSITEPYNSTIWGQIARSYDGSIVGVLSIYQSQGIAMSIGTENLFSLNKKMTVLQTYSADDDPIGASGNTKGLAFSSDGSLLFMSFGNYVFKYTLKGN